MADRRKLIVVSNRGPIVYSRDADGRRVARRGGGGLVTALSSLVTHHDVTWVASAISDDDRALAEEAGGEAVAETARDGSPYRVRLVAHDPRSYDWYYNVVSNPILWFAQHYLWGLSSAPDWNHGVRHAWSEGYVTVNRNFANAVVAELEREPDATVFFHDYHLYVAPSLVREQLPDATLAHFVHIPWPQPDYWRVLPAPIRRAVHEGLLANDVVSFHTRRWRINFLRSCADLTDAEVDFGRCEARTGDGAALARFCPISVD
ncbi:MAG: trehalose-6-phosphate synthase, partial [Actinomycetota bacterium]|nr:trehalose-6-phosphate synthase [Actinomycetota bacterium]